MPVLINGRKVAEINNRKNYLVNGRTDILEPETKRLIASYARFGRVYDASDLKAGRWRDARKWSEELKVNLVDAIGNTLLGSGDVPGGANHGDTHLFSRGKDIIGMLQREKLPFFRILQNRWNLISWPGWPAKSSPANLAKAWEKSLRPMDGR